MRPIARRLALAFAALVAPIALSVTCAEPTAPVTVGSVTVTGSATNVIVGQTLQLAAEVRSDDNAVLTDRPVTWSANPAGVATVSNTGLVTTLTTGNVTITATAGGVSGIYNMVVLPIPVATVEVTPATPTIIVGATQQLTATTKSAGGATLTGRVVTWVSATPATATVSGTGLVTGVAPGTVVITATSETIDGTSTVTVNPIPIATVEVTPALDTLHPTQTVQLAAQPKSGSGAALTGRVVTWSSLDTLVATVNATGLVTAMGTGTATIRATSEGVIGPATIVVVPVPVDTIVVTPLLDTLEIGDTLQMTAQTRDSAGGVLAGRPYTWSSSQPSRATVSATGLVTALDTGSVNILATSPDGPVTTATLVVRRVPVATVIVSPSADTLIVPQTAQLAVVLTTATGDTLTDRIVTWSSTDDGVASVDQSGLVSSVGVGTAQIIATSEGVADSATIVVTLVPVKQILFSIINTSVDSIDVLAGVTVATVAYPKDSTGADLNGRVITYSSANPAVATISAAGVIEGVGTGSTVVIATSEGVSDTIRVWSASLDFDQVAVGGEHTCALTTGGDAWCWGLNQVGELGNGVPADTALATRVGGGLAFVRIRASGGEYLAAGGGGKTCGLTSGGAVYCWGSNNRGTLGDGTTNTNKNATPTLVGGGHTFADIAVGPLHACGITTGNETYCWGYNGAYAIGDSTSVLSRPSPTLVLGGLAFTEVAMGLSGNGAGQTCGITGAGAAYCWGWNGQGQLGVGPTPPGQCEEPPSLNPLCRTPAPVVGGHTFAHISAGLSHTCGVTTGGDLYCWGSNLKGELGNGTRDTIATRHNAPELVIGGHTWSTVAAGNESTCALTTTGAAYCWGENGSGELGNGSTVTTHTPTAVSGGLTWQALSKSSGIQTCGTTLGGVVYCWGNNNSGQIGRGIKGGGVNNALVPARVSGQP